MTFQDEKQPLVFLVILNWNVKEDSPEILASINQFVYQNFKVIVVDNGSTGDSVDVIRARFPQFSVLETNKNLGYAEGNNFGIRHALEHEAEFILVLINDTVVNPQLLNKLVSGAAQHPDTGFLGARLLYHDRPEYVWHDSAKWNASLNCFEYPGQNVQVSSLSQADHETDYVCGSALFVRAETARQIGLTDEQYYLVWEEVGWCYRAKEVGWSCIVVSAALVWHKVGVSFGGEGFRLQPGEDLLVGDTSGSFAAQVIALLVDSDLHIRLAGNGCHFIEQNYSVPGVGQLLDSTMQRLAHLRTHKVPLRQRLTMIMHNFYARHVSWRVKKYMNQLVYVLAWLDNATLYQTSQCFHFPWKCNNESALHINIVNTEYVCDANNMFHPEVELNA